MNQKNYVVVGGSHGIGLSIVKRLVAGGAAVTAIARTSDHLTGLSGVTAIEMDVLKDEIHADQLPESIDGLAYCPGSINLLPIRALTPEAMIADFQLNVVGAVKCLQASLRAMKAAEASTMVMFSSVAVSQGLPMHASVAASKGAVEGLTRSFAAELAPKIRVNCVAPSLTDTPLAARLLSSESKRHAMAERHPLKRIGTPDDIAAIAEFLLTNSSSWITGQVIGVDGGMATLRV
ncbi:3-oxoacyl-[acyl-carrier-protein] reductase FabG1 [Roseimaritima multifibrata]|uniref:3-oxoacyl-[acyl-carrier-protein] reductase FabG1 n=1 Tax=Roseimaritima multifibrata TaxID=1930274 RepID=A0A517MGE3_9BACT|nr:SDR family oxidoreductase [Roseimaritima multifibrata]QDS93960.1 3-oxoacyl-[acyl-carrier-protein] reductase FabG1 [Roseimaritima multifibrata]